MFSLTKSSQNIFLLAGRLSVYVSITKFRHLLLLINEYRPRYALYFIMETVLTLILHHLRHSFASNLLISRDSRSLTHTIDHWSARLINTGQLHAHAPFAQQTNKQTRKSVTCNSFVSVRLWFEKKLAVVVTHTHAHTLPSVGWERFTDDRSPGVNSLARICPAKNKTNKQNVHG